MSPADLAQDTLIEFGRGASLLSRTGVSVQRECKFNSTLRSLAVLCTSLALTEMTRKRPGNSPFAVVEHGDY